MKRVNKSIVAYKLNPSMISERMFSFRSTRTVADMNPVNEESKIAVVKPVETHASTGLHQPIKSRVELLPVCSSARESAQLARAEKRHFPSFGKLKVKHKKYLNPGNEYLPVGASSSVHGKDQLLARSRSRSGLNFGSQTFTTVSKLKRIGSPANKAIKDFAKVLSKRAL